MMTTHKRLEVLDGLRAMAIVLVLATHSIGPFWRDLDRPFLPLGPIDIGSFFLNGWTGVDLFFVLSGFLITSQLLQSDLVAKGGDKKEALLYYLKKRFWRIAPAYYLVLTMFCLVGFLFHFIPVDGNELGWRYLCEILFLHDYCPADMYFLIWPLAVTWSLAIEMKFYLLAPFLVIFLKRLKKPAFQWIFFLFAFSGFIGV